MVCVRETGGKEQYTLNRALLFYRPLAKNAQGNKATVIAIESNMENTLSLAMVLRGASAQWLRGWA